MGSWAGSAAAQADDGGGWFDDPSQAQPLPPEPDEPGASDPAERAEPDYSPPPPDFQTRPSAEAAPSPESQETDGQAQQRAVEEFSPRLAPYGRWVDDPWYGRVWVPSRSVVGGEFVPYSTAGHWELTPSDAWLWASDYPFGAITFHYGRWVWAAGSTWAWVPGYAYAPAWVEFRVGASGYIGWSPLPAHYVWRRGAFLSVGIWQPAPLVYCPTRYVFAHSLPRYVIRDPARVRSISSQTRVYRSGPNYLRGPSPREARIPHEALPERRVIAQPRIALQGNASTRSRLESARLPANRGYGRAEIPTQTYQYRSQERFTAPRPYRSYDERSFQYRSREVPSRQGRPNGYVPAPNRSGPAVRRREPPSGWGAASPRGAERGVPPRQQFDRNQAVPRDRAGAVPFRSDRQPMPRAVPRMEGDSHAVRRARRSDSSNDNNKSDSRTRGRERYGSGR